MADVQDFASRNVPETFDPRRLEVLDPIVMEIMRRKTPAERLQIAYDMNRFARSRIRSHLRWLHPEWTEEAIGEELAKRVLRGSS